MTPKRTPRRKTTSRAGHSGITLVELLISVLILAIMLGVAIPLYVSSQNSSKQTACQANMSAIFQAEETYRSKSQTRSYTTNLSNLSTTSLVTLPVCPCGTGAYTITTTGAGSTLALTITCPNTGAHVSGKTMVTSDGQAFSFQ